MGLFGDIFDGIFGGGDNNVQQTANQNTSVTTQVDVKNEVTVTTEAIAAVLQQFGLKVTEASEDTKELIKTIADQMSKQNLAELVGQLQFNELIRLRTKQAGYIAAGIFVFWFLFRGHK